MKTTYKLTLILLALLLAACGNAPSQDTVQTAIVQTQAAQPSNIPPPAATDAPTPIPTEMPINILELDFESILLVNGDLREGYTGSVITDELPGNKLFNNLFRGSYPLPDRIVSQEIEQEGKESYQIITIMLYSDLQAMNRAYQSLTTSSELTTIKVEAGTTIEAVDNIGEMATVATEPININMHRYQTVIFIRCSALVYMRTTADTENYAERLDSRISDLICP